jgi:hypothetical protein
MEEHRCPKYRVILMTNFLVGATARRASLWHPPAALGPYLPSQMASLAKATYGLRVRRRAQSDEPPVRITNRKSNIIPHSEELPSGQRSKLKRNGDASPAAVSSLHKPFARQGRDPYFRSNGQSLAFAVGIGLCMIS